MLASAAPPSLLTVPWPCVTAAAAGLSPPYMKRGSLYSHTILGTEISTFNYTMECGKPDRGKLGVLRSRFYGSLNFARSPREVYRARAETGQHCRVPEPFSSPG